MPKSKLSPLGGSSEGLVAQTGKSALPSITLQQIEHFPVKLCAAEFFIFHIWPGTVKHPKTSTQIPKRPAPASFFPKFQAILHPGQRHFVRRAIEGPPFADVNADTFLLEFFPRLDSVFAQPFLVHCSPPIEVQGPAWL